MVLTHRYPINWFRIFRHRKYCELWQVNFKGAYRFARFFVNRHVYTKQNKLSKQQTIEIIFFVDQLVWSDRIQ